MIDSNSVDIPEEESRLVKELIDGKKQGGNHNERGFIFDIVASERAGFPKTSR